MYGMAWHDTTTAFKSHTDFPHLYLRKCSTGLRGTLSIATFLLFFFFHPINIQIMARNERPIRHHFSENLSWHRVMVTWSFPTWQWKGTHYGQRAYTFHHVFDIRISLQYTHHIPYIPTSVSAFFSINITSWVGVGVGVGVVMYRTPLYTVPNGYFLSNRKITTHFELYKCLDPNNIRLGIKKFSTFHFMAVRILSRLYATINILIQCIQIYTTICLCSLAVVYKL